MRIRLSFICLVLFGMLSQAQDLNCKVQVNTDNIQGSNTQIFKDLENAISQFMNQKKWIDAKVTSQERINCNIVINLTYFNIDQFRAEANITSSRPVYGSSYNSKTFTHYDLDWSFSYQQFQALDFQEGANVSDLTSILAFYANIIIGVDFDCFSLEGGTPYFQKALQIRSATTGLPGWGTQDGKGNRNRYYLIDNYLDDRFKPLRKAQYLYHLKGLDIMNDDVDQGRAQVFEAIKELREVHRALPNSVALRILLNSKKEEIINIFKEASPAMKNKVIELLGIMDPANRSDYDAIKKS